MNAIQKFSDATAASIQASLLAVTVEDICRILIRHAITKCQSSFGTSSGRLAVSVDYATWTIAVSHEPDHTSQLSSHSTTTAQSVDEHELDLLSHLGLLQLSCSSSTGTTVCIWQDGRKSCSDLPSSPLVTPPPSASSISGRGVSVTLRDVFSGMPVRRKFIATEAQKRSQTEALANCVREMSLLVPEANVTLSIRHGSARTSKTILNLPKAKDVVHRCRAAFGPDSIDVENARPISTEHTFANVGIKVDGFVCLTAATSTPQIIFVNGRIWPGASTRGSSHSSERDSAAFAALLGTFQLEWSDEPRHRLSRRTALSPHLYQEVCERITALFEGSVFETTSAGHAFVLNVQLSHTSDVGADTLNVGSFRSFLLDAICARNSTTASSTPRKRKRSSKTSHVIENDVSGSGSPVRSRPATVSLATESYGKGVDVPEGMMEWRDPMNGRLFHIDRRTGHSTPIRPLAASMDETDTAPPRFNPARGGTIVDRTSLNRGLSLSPSKRPTTSNLDDSDEFDDPMLNAALASIPSPSPAPSVVDTVRSSRFFDSRRPESPLKFKTLPPDDMDESTTHRPSTSDLELAISRNDLQKAIVLDQVDGKFILCTTTTTLNPVLFCIDQHAADERYRLERMLQDFVADCVGSTASHVLPATLTLGIARGQYDAIRNDSTGLTRLGWEVEKVVMVHEGLGHAQVDLTGIPYVLRERVLTDKGRVKDLGLLEGVFVSCVDDAAAFHPSNGEGEEVDWLAVSRAIPSALMDVLRSKACRSAIMFNDPLDRGGCKRVVERLAECKFPFQCAHGRPSLVPLCEIKTRVQGGEDS